MGEELTPSNKQADEAVILSYDRILSLLGLLVLLGTLGTSVFISVRFGAGILIGGIFSVLNYYWLKSLLRKFFEKSADGASSVRMALRFIFRYLVFAVVLLVVFLTGIVPVIAVLFGLAGFALAVMAEGIISIFKPARV